MSIQELERALATLPLEEARRLRRLLDSRIAEEKSDGTAMPDRNNPTVYDLVKDLISIGTGPAVPDLSSNKAHLKGFGEGSLR